MDRKGLIPAAVLAVVVAWPLAALAQRPEGSRGNIISIDQNNHTIQLKDAKGRVATWKFDAVATVKFTDQTEFWPHPSVKDLQPPMYVHYTFTNDTIHSFDVVEVGFRPGTQPPAATRTPGVSRTVTGTVTAYDPNVRQVEIDVNGRRETFQLTPRSDRRLNPGDRVELRTSWSGPQELVTEVRTLGTSGGTTGGGNRGGGQSGSAQGQVVSISQNGVVMQLAGGQQAFTVNSRQMLQQLRIGDTVRFDWTRDNNGQTYITRIH
ncbi:MAG TPA: hypothetical protein VMX54_05010 [Vicinamibacteria bacterium]|nr:hypothetical protein [Vicinamibacteria bacterium]